MSKALVAVGVLGGFAGGYTFADFLYKKTLSESAKSAPFDYLGEHLIRFGGPLVSASLVALFTKGVVRYSALSFMAGHSLKWIFMDELPDVFR